MAIDYSIQNNEGEPIIDWAQGIHHQAVGGKSKYISGEIVTLLQLQRDLQRGQLLSFLDPHLIHDLAAMVTSYISQSVTSTSTSTSRLPQSPTLGGRHHHHVTPRSRSS